MIRSLKDDNLPDPPTIGPMDSGRLMTLEEFQRSRGEDGYVYEIIDGVLIVSPNPAPSHDFWVDLIHGELKGYAKRQPRQANRISQECEVIIPSRPGATRPQPDIAVYRNFPDPFETRWDDVCPILVVEVISDRRGYKDCVRNRHLYWTAGGIIEYWIVDPRENPRKPTVTQLVKKPGAKEWNETVIPFGKTIKSAALPKFSINLKKITSNGK